MALFRSKWVAFGLMLVVLVLAASPAWAQDAAKKPQGQNFFHHYFLSGGPIVWFIELPLSIVILALGITYGLKYRRVNLLPIEELQRIVSLLTGRQYRAAMEETGRSPTMMGYALNKAMSLAPLGYVAMERALEDAVNERTSSLASKIEPLNVIGNIGPLIGLFGTVVGMVDTFNAVVAKGGAPEAGDLATGISVALVTTVWGLLIAIPGLATYGLLRNRLDRFANEATVRGQEVLGEFRSSAAAPRPGGAAPAAQNASAGPRGAAPVAEQA